jgi:hypothetical protein
MDVDKSPWALPYGQAQRIVQSSNRILEDLGLPTFVRTAWLLAGVIIVIFLGRRFTLKVVAGLGILPLLVACMAQIIYYKGTTHVAQRSWYWVSQLFFTALVAGILLAILYRFLKRVAYGEILSRAVTAALLLAIVVSHTSYILNLIPIESPSKHVYLEQSRWLEGHTEEGSIIAIANAGALGYFTRDRTVVNMDGVINSMEYLKNLQYGMGAEHLASNGVDYVFGNPAFVEGKPPYRDMLEGKLDVEARLKYGGDEFVLWRFVP